MTTTSKHTPGPVSIQQLETHYHGYDWPTFAIRSERNICLAVVGDVDRASAEDNGGNAELIAEAFNVAHETGLTPRQFAEQLEQRYGAAEVEAALGPEAIATLNSRRAAIDAARKAEASSP